MEFSLARRHVHHQFALHRSASFHAPSLRVDPMRHPPAPTSTIVRCAFAAALLAVATSCANPKAQAAIAQELNDAANEISAVKGDVAQLQSDVDSLRQVVAKQDTVISRLVEVTHVPR